MITTEIKCEHCGVTNLHLDYVEELDYKTGFMRLVFECMDCDEQTIIQATANDREKM